jgi:hypothetical protein
MKQRLKRGLTGAGALVAAGGLLLASAGTAFATQTTVGWENDSNRIGTVTLLDATGAPVTSGSLSAKPFAAYAVASHAGRSDDTQGQLWAATPQVGVNGQQWNSDQLSAGPYSPADPSVPASVSGTGLPFATGTSTDFSMSDYIGEFPNTLTTAGYQNLYEIRIYTSGANAANTAVYDAIDIAVDTTAGTWQVVYPAAPSSGTAAYPDATDVTTTTLTTNPTSPATVSGNPTSVTLNASVSPATAVPSGYAGPIGTVQFFDGTTQVGKTQLVTGTGPYTASVADSVANPSSHTFTAKFAPYIGTGLTTSASSAKSFSVAPPAPPTSTALSVTAGQFAGDQNSYVATVTYPSGSTCTGTVDFFDNGTSKLNSAAVGPASGKPNEFDFTNTFNSPGSHSVTAVFNPADASVCASSTSAANQFSQATNPNGACSPAQGGQCTSVSNIEADVPAGVLVINTPYTGSTPLDLGKMSLDGSGTMFTASKQFGESTTDPSKDILITDTRAGNLPWTAQAQSSALTDGGTKVGSSINGENVGLTGLTLVPVTGNGFNGTASNFTTTANPAAAPAVAPGDTGIKGLGNAPHTIAQAKQGIGSIGLLGTLTLNAPSSTEAGHFTGTITFTLVGSLV